MDNENRVNICDFGFLKLENCEIDKECKIDLSLIQCIAPESRKEKVEEKMDNKNVDIESKGELPSIQMCQLQKGVFPQFSNSINEFSAAIIRKCTAFNLDFLTSFRKISLNSPKLAGLK